MRAWKPKRRKADSFEELASVQEETLAGILDFLEPYDVTRALTDQFAARGVLDRLGRDGVYAQQLAMSATTKTAIYSNLRAALYDGSLIVPEIPDLVAELRRLRTKFSAGSASVVNPRVGGSHGDLAQAVSMAAFLLRGGGSNDRLPRSGGRGVGAALKLNKSRPGVTSVRSEQQFDEIEDARGGRGGKWGGRH